MVKHDADTLKELQAMPLNDKVALTEDRIIEFYEHYDGKVVISFSGGKDSTVLLNIARRLFPNIRAAFSNTGLEYPEIQAFVKEHDNVDIVRPKMTFRDIITNYGYPLISKEVAEAIFYARRNQPSWTKLITGQYTIPDERGYKEAVRRQRDLTGQHQYGPETAHARSIHNPGQGGGTEDRAILSDSVCTGRKQRMLGTYKVPPEYGGATSRSKSTELLGNRRDGGGISLYNKARWLPLAHVPFRIHSYCCNVMKKLPMHAYQSANGVRPILATLATESRMRKQAWVRTGCNAFEGKDPKSTPMAFWTEDDVLRYIDREKLPICTVYGEVVCDSERCRNSGLYRTGCIFCMFGANHKDDHRFQQLRDIQPRLYDYCMRGGQWVDNPDYIEGLPSTPNELGWIPWNPKKIWTPSAEGLGMRYVIDCVNAIYGAGTIKY